MFCTRCGASVSANAAFCTACGTRLGGVAGAAPSMTRPGIITLLAVLQFIGGTLCLLAGLVATVAAVVGDPADSLALLGGTIFVMIGALELTCGFGLWKMKPYGRTIQLVFAWIGLLAVPVGTVISILILVYLFKPGIKVLFSGKPAIELTATEVAQVNAVSQGSLVVVLVVIFAVLGSIAALGIVAAIAIPGLLRARMAANEAAAIGSLRTINSGQAAFAASCGTGFYAATLTSLAVPQTAGQPGFVDASLALDPIVKSGYMIRLDAGAAARDAPPACNGASLVETYFVSAEPVTVGTTGLRFFAANQEGTVYQSPSTIEVTHAGAPAGATAVR